MSVFRKADRAAAAEARKEERQAVASAEADKHEAVVRPTPQTLMERYDLKPGEAVPLHILNAMAEASRAEETAKIEEASVEAAKAITKTLGGYNVDRKMALRHDNAAKAAARLAALKV